MRRLLARLHFLRCSDCGRIRRENWASLAAAFTESQEVPADSGLVYEPGTFVKLTGGTLDLGVIWFCPCSGRQHCLTFSR